MSRLETVSRETVDKYMIKIQDRIVEITKEALPDREHYVATYATWANKAGSVDLRLLSCGVQDLPEEGESAEDFGFTAEDIGDYLIDVLHKYGKSFENLEFLSGDNASVNLRLANLISEWLLNNKGIRRVIPLVGCGSHRLNLAIQKLFAPGTAEGDSVEAVATLMAELRSLKNGFKLMAKPRLCPVRRNDTRWGSVHAILQRFLDLYPILPTCAFSQATKNMIPNPGQHLQITELVKMLKECEVTSKWLQNEDATKVNLMSVREAFDDLIDKYPTMADHIGKDARVIHNKDFENAIVKLQCGTDRLTRNEETAVSIFRTDALVNEEQEDGKGDDEESLSYDEKMAKKVDAKKSRFSKFRSTLHVSATSNVVERLFSRAKLVMTDHRKHNMDPSTLEMFLMLRMNKDLWDEKTVETIIAREKIEAREKKAAKEQAEKEAREAASEEDE